MSKNVQNEELGFKVMKCIQHKEYKKGQVLLKRQIIKAVKDLACENVVDLSELKAFKSSSDEEESLGQACQFAIQKLKKLGYIKEEGYDKSSGLGTGDEKVQYRLLIDTKDLIVKQGVRLVTNEEIMAEAQGLKKMLGV